MEFSKRYSDPFDSISKLAMAGGIVIVVIALSFLLGNEVYQLTRSVELQVATVGCVILVFAFLSYRIFKDV